MINLPAGIQAIDPLLQKTEQYYLVGGAIRDALLSLSSQDIDIVCTEDARSIARKLSDQVSGSFFILDEERNACRVISKNSDGTRLVYDFSQLKGATIEADLLERDFTINAMAVDLSNPGEIIDPLKGGRDLFEKWLRPCKVTSLIDDPLRVIRAIRYAVKYDLRIENDAIHLLKQAIEQLASVSRERKRDELFKILDNDKPWIAFELLMQLKMLPFIIPFDIPQINNAISRLAFFSKINSFLMKGRNSINADNFLTSTLISEFMQQREVLKKHLLEENLSNRSTKSLDGLAAILWDVDHLETERIAEVLALSKDEQNHLSSMLVNKRKVIELLQCADKLDNRMVYQFYRSTGIDGVDICLLTLADEGKFLSSEINIEVWLSLIDVCQHLIAAWFDHPEIVDPKLILTGRDLMFNFDLNQGPLIGELLNGLKEEQAAGKVVTRVEAMEWIETQLHKGSNRPFQFG